VSHKVDLNWAEEECSLQTSFTVEVVNDGIVVSGTCPRCEGDTTWSFRKGDLGRFSKDVAAVATQKKPIVICACGHPHKDRPSTADEDGCGAYWRVTLAT
jgi:metal-dependent hydrolase (beta-lactamase superfamily II)